MLPNSRVTTVDCFDLPGVEERCRRNLAPYGSRAEIIKMDAAAALKSLSDRRFDVIYLDAAKSPHDAFAQSALAWPLLKVGGVIIWDDLLWKAPPSGSPLFVPERGRVPAFYFFARPSSHT
jgi:predicted O-methyltransferase YrrM